ncbi:tyrosine-protein kinase family protein [Mucilaginibacter sp. dw_454]|uniref:GumC family protein n=1 Tax=Mucilaginibacter sp. dw_454 TaxID=2720079 RepID=UPI001BD6496D|nr:tyrosine-protein kinase family protein [Mucilaginibacter sp. dw_454]
MLSKQPDNYPVVRSFVTDDSFKIKDVLKKYTFYWPWFVLTIAIALSLAIVYSKLAKPVYEVDTTIIIKEHNDVNNTPKSAGSVLQELDVTGNDKVVDNEIELLKSRNLITEVVNHLQLYVDYYKYNEILGKQNLYGRSPVTFKLFSNLANLPAAVKAKGFVIYIKNSESFLFKMPNADTAEYQFKDTINNGLGSFKIDPNVNIRDYIGSTMPIKINDPESTVDGYQKSIDVVLTDKLASVLDISVTDEIPQRGKDFLNNLIVFYTKADIAEKNATTQNTLKFIDQRLDSLTLELNNAEGKVEDFRAKRGLTNIGLQSQVFLQNQQSNDGRLNDIKVQLNVINKIEDYFNSPNPGNREIPSTLGIADAGLLTLVQRFAELQQDRSRMAATTPDKNPALEPLDKQIATTKSAVKDNIQNIKSSLLAMQQQLQNFGSGYKSSIEQIPGQERELTNLERQQKIKDDLYTYLLQKREEIGLSYASTLANARLVDKAHVLPLKSTKALIPFAAALLLGLLIPLVIIFARDTIRNRVLTRSEIEQGTGLPIVGEFKKVKLRSPIVFDAINEKLSIKLIEQFRRLRAQLHYLHDNENKGRITLIASSVEGEDNGFIPANLAVALAASGKKTMLIELNIYNPVFHEFFNLPEQHPGLSSYLDWNSLKEDVIQTSATYRNLDIITCGAYISSFSELLDRKRIEDLFEWLRANYDHIIVDTAPGKSTSDVSIVARLCDITLYIVKQNFSSKSLLPYIKKLNEDGQLPKMSMLFNGIGRRIS